MSAVLDDDAFLDALVAMAQSDPLAMQQDQSSADCTDEPLFDMLPSLDAGFMDQLDDAFNTPDGASSSDTDTLMDEHAKPAASASSAKRIRKGRKQELDELRAVETTLKGRLSRIKAKLEFRDKRSSKRFWENVAQRMLIEKKLAIRENQRLRALVREQVKAVKALESSFTKSSNLSYSDIVPPAINTTTSLLTDTTEDVYTALFQKIESSYKTIKQNIDSKPATAGGDGKRHVTMDLQRDDTGGTLICIQLEEAKTVPLGFSFLGNRAWYYLSQVHEHERQQGFHRVFERKGEDLIGACELHCIAELAPMRGHVALRKYVETNRVTLVWETAGVQTCELKPFQESGWVVFEPSPEDPVNIALCRVGVQSPQLLTSSDSSEPYARDIGSITELVLGVYEKTVGCITEKQLDLTLQSAMDQPFDLDDAFMKEIMQIVSPTTSDASTPSDSELSFSPEPVASPSLARVRPYGGTFNQNAPTAAATKPRPKRIRKGRKSELLELQAEVETYKKKLDNLVLRKHDKSAPKDGSFWQRSAHRIALEKRLAIRENSRLRSLTERQLSTIKALQQSILAIETSNRTEAQPTIGHKSSDIALLDCPVQFNGNMHSILRSPTNLVGNRKIECHCVSSTNAVAPLGTSARRLEVDFDTVDGVPSVCIQLEDVHSVPFNFHFAGVHAWKYLSQSHDHERRQGIYRNFQREGDALFGVVMLDCCPQKCGVGGQVLLRKHVDQHSVSFVWEMSPHGCLTAMDAHKKGCLRFEPSTDNPNHASVCITNVDFEPHPLGESGVGAAIEGVLSMYESTIGFLRQAVIASLHEQATLAT